MFNIRNNFKKIAVCVSVMLCITIIVFLFSYIVMPASSADKKPTHVKLTSVSVNLFSTIFSRSRMQKIDIITNNITVSRSKKFSKHEYINVRPIFKKHNISDTVLFVYALDKSGNIKNIKWYVSDLQNKSHIGHLRIDIEQLHTGMSLKIGILRTIRNSDGYFVGDIGRVRDSWGVRSFNGCYKIANGISYNTEYSSDLTVIVMSRPGAGFHGWCYKYGAGKHKEHESENSGFDYTRGLHYFAASSASSWSKVAAWMSHVYSQVLSMPSGKIDEITKDTGIQDPNISENIKIARVKKWIKKNIKYSVLSTQARTPPTFDSVVAKGYGDCKGLSLVMVKLLRKVGIDAHTIILSADDPYVFNRNSANLILINHVAVYIPSTNEFYDPSVGTGDQLHGYEVMDIVTRKILIVPFPITTKGRK